MAEVSLKQKAFSGLLWSAAEGWGRQAIAFIVFAMLARFLDAQAFGLVALAYVFLSFVQIFVHQGFTVAIVQMHEVDESHLDTAFWSNLCISIILTIFSICISGYVANLLKQPQIQPIIQCLSCNFIFYALSSVQDSILRRQMKFKSLAVRSFAAICAGGVVGVTLAFMGFGVWSLVIKQFIESIIGTITLWNISDWRPGFKVSVQNFKSLFTFGITIVGIEITNYISVNSDNFIIGYFLGTTALGYYSIAYKFLVTSNSFITAIISGVTFPLFSKLQKETERLRNSFYMATKLSSVVNLPFFCSMSALTPELISVMFGDKWLPSAFTMQILTIMGFNYSLTYLYTDIIISMGKPDWRLKVMFLSAILNSVGFFIAAHWGISAVAISLVIQSFFIATPLYLFGVQKLILIDFKIYAKQFMLAVACSITTTSAIVGSKQLISNSLSIPITLSISILIGIIVYTGTIRVMDPKIFEYFLNLFQKKSSFSTD